MTESSDAPKKGPSQRDRERFSNRRTALSSAVRVAPPLGTHTVDDVLTRAEAFFEWLEKETDKT